MKKTIIAVCATLALVSGNNAFADNGRGSGVSHIENQNKIFEGTERGKTTADWSNDRVIKKGESVQCWNENLMRGGISGDNCK